MESSENIFLNNLENKPNDVLVSFDGSTPHCMSKLGESIADIGDESTNTVNRSKSRSRAHPKVKLPFCRSTKRISSDQNPCKATSRKDTQIKTSDSAHEGSTQETESNRRIPASHYKFKTQFKSYLKGRLDGNCVLNPQSKNTKFIFVNNLESLEDNIMKEEVYQKDIFKNFNSPCFSPDSSYRKLDRRVDDKSSMRVIESMKKNMQKFLIPSPNMEEPQFACENAAKVEKSAFKSHRYPSFSVPKQRSWLISSDKSLKRTKFDLKKLKGKLRVNTRLILRDDPGYLNASENRERHNYSVVNSPTVDLTGHEILKNESEAKNRTIESRDESVNSTTFKLPQLSTRSKRRAKYSTSSARKKLPKCFLMDDDELGSSRKSIKMNYLKESNKVSKFAKKKIEQFRIAKITTNDTGRLLKAQIGQKEWNDSIRFAPILHN